MSTRASAAAVAVAMVVAAACGGSTARGARALGAAAIPETIKVTSPAFANNGMIPRANTCDGTGTAPAVAWSAVPPAAKSVAVVVDDPDAPGGAPFVHWIVVGLPAAPGTLPSTSSGVHALDNGRGTLGWTPPCPPTGAAHRYHFTVYALSDYVCADNGDASNGPDCSPPAAVAALSQIRNTALAKGVLVGSYRR